MVAIAKNTLNESNHIIEKGTVCSVVDEKIICDGLWLCDENTVYAQKNFIVVDEDLLNKIRG